MALTQTLVVADASEAGGSLPQRVALVGEDGAAVELGGGAPAEGSVGTGQLADSAVTHEKIAAGAVTPANLAAYDAGSGHGKSVRVKADGSGFDFVEPPAPATTIPQGALIGGAGLSITRGENGALTAKVADKGITAAMLADGVAASGPKGDPGQKGADGKSVTAIALTVDSAGKVTGGTATLSDGSTVAIAVTTAPAAGA